MSAPPNAPPAAGKVRSFVGWLVLERVARGVVALVVTGVMARQLGPAGYGELNTALALAGMLMPLANLGLDTFVIRDLMAEPARAGAVLGTAAGLRLLAGALCALGLGVWAWLTGAPVAGALLLPAALMLLWQAGETADAWFRQRVLSRTTALVRLGTVLAGAGVKLGLAAAGAGPAAFVWVFSAEALVFGAALMLAQHSVARTDDRWRWEPARAAAWLRAGWGFVAGAALASVAFRFDQLAVQRLLGNDAAGQYFAAVRLMEIPFFLATAVATALLPALAAAQADPAAAARRLELSFEATAAVAWATALGATLLGPWLVPLIFGAAYAPAVPALIILAWGQLALLPGLVRAQYLSLHPAPGTQALLAVAALAATAGGCLALVPRLGLTGAALAGTGTHLLAGLGLSLVVNALRPCAAPQARALLLPFRPRRWAGLWRELV